MEESASEAYSCSASQ